MKRLLAPAALTIVTLVLAAFGSLMAVMPASASDTPPSNVWLFYHHQTSGDLTVFDSNMYDPTAEYGVSSCDPQACGTLVVITDKKPKLAVSMTTGETFVTGHYRYATKDYSYQRHADWNGSPIRLVKKVRNDNGRLVRVYLIEAYAYVYREGAPVPPPAP